MEERIENIEGEVTLEMIDKYSKKLFVIAKDDEAFAKLLKYCECGEYGTFVFNKEDILVTDVEIDGGYNGIVFCTNEDKVLNRIEFNILTDCFVRKIDIYQPYLVE